MTPQAATAMQPSKPSTVSIQTEPLEGFNQQQKLYDSIARRAFEIFNNNGRWFGRELSDWFQAEAELIHPVHLEIAESDDALTIRAEVPGFTAKELDIRVAPRQLIITGKHESKEENKNGKTIYSEQCAQEVFRSIDLPSDIECSKVSATLKNGILNLELPKSPRPRSVRVQPTSLG